MHLLKQDLAEIQAGQWVGITFAEFHMQLYPSIKIYIYYLICMSY